MAFIEPAARGRRLFAILILLGAAFAACSRRVPVLVPPSCEVEAVEGFGSALIVGTEASVKGKFGFVFRKSGLGRIEAIDPIGRTAFIILFREGRAWFVLPGRKVYAEDVAGVMMERFLGVALDPREAVLMLSGTWGRGATRPELNPGDDVLFADDVWGLINDAQGRVVGGVHELFSFAVKSFFPGDAVPREISLRGLGTGTSGRIRILELAFNPEPRDAAFDPAFLRAYAPKTWDEILELLDR
jgi:hypothetical protein